MVNGKMIKLMDMDNTHILMALNTKDIGLMTNNTAEVKNIGQMVLSMKVTTSLVKKMDMVNSIGLTKAHMPEISLTITFTDMVDTDGLMIENTKANG